MVDGCDNPATFTGTFFEDGTSVTVCESDFVNFAAGVLEAMTNVPVTMLITLPPETFAVESDPNAVEPVEGGPTSPESSEVGTESDHELADDERNYGLRYGGYAVDDDDAEGVSHLDLVHEVAEMEVVHVDGEADTLTNS
jgi:hypothetical protein